MKYSFLAIFTLLLSCQTEDPCKSFPLGTPFQLPQGETLVHCTEEISISFLELVSDSRCPSGVQCIWEGMVEVQLAVKVKGNETTFNLSSAPDFGEKIPESTVVEGFVIRLEDALPYPKAGQSVDKKETSIVLFIQNEKG